MRASHPGRRPTVSTIDRVMRANAYIVHCMGHQFVGVHADGIHAVTMNGIRR